MEKEIWHNLIITYDGYSNGGDGNNRVGIYVNGKKDSLSFLDKRGGLGFIEDKNAHFSIGNMANSKGEPCTDSFFQGSLDDLMIFDRIITSNEIEQISSLKK